MDEEGVAAGGGDLGVQRPLAKTQKFVSGHLFAPRASRCLNPFVAPSESLDEEQLISSWDLMAGFTSIAGFNLAKPEEDQSLPGLVD